MQVGDLKPGLPLNENWRHFWRTLCSPRFHARYALARVRANFAEPPLVRRAGSILWGVGLLAVTAISGSWSMLFLAYVLPVGLLTQMSAWAGLLGLHHWVRLGHGKLSTLEELASVTSGRFLGEAAPEPMLKGNVALWEWTWWSVRMLAIHLPVRLAIAPGDLVSHDWHHWHATGDWPNAAYARRDTLVNDAGNYSVMVADLTVSSRGAQNHGLVLVSTASRR